MAAAYQPDADVDLLVLRAAAASAHALAARLDEMAIQMEIRHMKDHRQAAKA